MGLNPFIQNPRPEPEGPTPLGSLIQILNHNPKEMNPKALNPNPKALNPRSHKVRPFFLWMSSPRGVAELAERQIDLWGIRNHEDLLGFRVWGLGFRAYDLGFIEIDEIVQGLGEV